MMTRAYFDGTCLSSLSTGGWIMGPRSAARRPGRGVGEDETARRDRPGGSRTRSVADVPAPPAVLLVRGVPGVATERERSCPRVSIVPARLRWPAATLGFL